MTSFRASADNRMNNVYKRLLFVSVYISFNVFILIWTFNYIYSEHCCRLQGYHKFWLKRTLAPCVFFRQMPDLQMADMLRYFSSLTQNRANGASAWSIPRKHRCWPNDHLTITLSLHLNADTQRKVKSQQCGIERRFKSWSQNIFMQWSGA